MPMKRSRGKKAPGRRVDRTMTAAVPLQRHCCAACGRSSWPLYNVEDVLLCERCERKYGPVIRAETRR
jgi:hypothetical protein